MANPGCHATGFISMVSPVGVGGLLPPDADLFLLLPHRLLRRRQEDDRPVRGGGTARRSWQAPGLYGLGQTHKHLPEMQTICGLTKPPVFTPVVDDYYKGMATTVMPHQSAAEGVTLCTRVETYAAHYAGQRMVQVAPEGAAAVRRCRKAGDNDLTIVVAGNDQAFTVTALFDNLGERGLRRSGSEYEHHVRV